ncbi:cation diffusion facilitator family transporter [Colletotrichum karsti]|uniref:Cation diffusion facilitator family transporter n=1 Tax=Colletotrichum karsti TaxID=1095194 RepID=A0A9P6LI38_9PEZI|nr:cation diffusion facilitator family transporter [Colletotrichum karsti]KAF9873197.1 cation diffusion facilitator family transporter [Colletotrichum karsti]
MLHLTANGINEEPTSEMARPAISKKQRLVATIAISGAFFIAELVVGFRTKSLALIADAFHYMNDLIGFLVALLAVVLSERKEAPRSLTFGWKRAQVLGAFFNGVFLLALGVSILLQAVERFINLSEVNDPVLMLIMGCVGLGLNVLVMSFLHEGHHDHDHSHDTGNFDSKELTKPPYSVRSVPQQAIILRHEADVEKPRQSCPDPEQTVIKAPTGRDLGMLGVMIHVIGDAINNAGVIVAAVVIWKGNGEGRFYADPGVSLFIALTIMLSAWPLCKRAGHILLESAPPGINLDNVKSEAAQTSGVQAIPELRVWRIDQRTTLATAQVVVANDSLRGFETKAKAIRAYLQLHGIQAVALEPLQTLQKEIPEIS